jgi:cell shape-determining protein MreD
MLLPLSAPRYVVLLSAFLLGISIDVFSNTLGVHAFASVFIAYLRPVFIGAITNREEDMSDYAGIKQNGFFWFVYYASMMVVTHHLVLFYLEVFTFQNFWSTLLRVILSSISSVFVIVLSQFIVFKD